MNRPPAPVPSSQPPSQFNEIVSSELRYLHSKVDAIYNFQRSGKDTPSPCEKCEEAKRRPQPTTCASCVRTNQELDRLKIEFNKVLTAKYIVDLEKMPHEKIGQGVQAVVYKMTLNRTEVAVKVLKDCAGLLNLESEFDRSDLFIPLYFRHPNLVEMYGFGVGPTQFDKSLYVVMGLKEFSLDQFLIVSVEKAITVTPKLMVRMGRQMLSALIYLHANGVAHGQLMPENVLLERVSSTRYKIVLNNFGIAPKVDMYTRTKTTSDGGLKQFFPYYSPEAFRGQEETSANLGKKDMFAFGVTFWELVTTAWTMATTRYTFLATHVMQVQKLGIINRPSLALLPDCCHEFFGRTWDGEPANRYTSTQAFDAITVIRDLAKAASAHSHALSPASSKSPDPSPAPSPAPVFVPPPPLASAPVFSPSRTSFAGASKASIQEQLKEEAMKREGKFKEPVRRKPKRGLEGFFDRIMTLRTKMNEHDGPEEKEEEEEEEEEDDWI